MKNKIKQFIKQNDITEIESGSEEWTDMVIYVTGFKGVELEEFEAMENDETLKMWDYFSIKIEEILDELGVEVL